MAVEFNNDFFTELGNSPGVVALCVEKANNIATRARSTARVDTAGYREGIKVTTRKAKHRTVAVVTANDPESLIEESKTGNLARAVRAEARNG